MRLVSIEAIPPHILNDLRERGLSDFDISTSKPTTLLNEYMSWHGVIGYTGKFVEALLAFLQAESVVDREADPMMRAQVALMSTDEKVTALHKVMERGGGQAKEMASLWFKSDSLNRKRFEEAFPHIFLTYR